MKNKTEVVQFILDYLNNHFNYLILRNYENLPEDEGHDIDILISQQDNSKIRTFLKLIEQKFNIDIYVNNRYKNLQSNLLVMDDYILHLDFFFYIQWLNIPFFETSNLLLKKENYKSFFVLDTLSLERYCWFLYIIRNGSVKEKYKEKALLYEENPLKNINISLTDKKRKKKIIVNLLNKSYLKFITGVYTSISIKTLKLFSPYGCIINISNGGCNNLDIIRDYIFIGSKEYNSDVGFLDLINIYLLLTNEHIVILNNQTDKSKIKFLRKFMITCDDNLKEVVENILGEHKLN